MPFTLVDEQDVSATRMSLWTSGKSLTTLKKAEVDGMHAGDGNKAQTEQAFWLSAIRQNLSLLALPFPFQAPECALPAELQRV